MAAYTHSLILGRFSTEENSGVKKGSMNPSSEHLHRRLFFTYLVVFYDTCKTRYHNRFQHMNLFQITKMNLMYSTKFLKQYISESFLGKKTPMQCHKV